MNKIPKHNVFISHHDADRAYKKRFIQMMGDFIVDMSVDEDDIDDPNPATETIRRGDSGPPYTPGFCNHSAYRIVHLAADARGRGDSFQYQAHGLQPKMRTIGHLVTEPSGLPFRRIP